MTEVCKAVCQCVYINYLIESSVALLEINNIILIWILEDGIMQGSRLEVEN